MDKRLLPIALAAFFLLPLSTVQAAGLGVDAFMSTRIDASQMGNAASLLKELGVTWTRQEFNYENIGGTTGTNFGADDDALNAEAAQGIHVLGLLNFSGDTPPAAQDWQTFVDNVTAHFAGKVDAWEVMNEPDDAAKPSRQMAAATYNDYLSRSFTEIRKNDPTATVVSAGTAGVDISWLDKLFAAGGCQYLDAIAVHPYRSDRPTDLQFGQGDFANYISLASNLMDRDGCGTKKIWVTEFGVRSDAIGQTDEANFEAQSLIMGQTVPKLENILLYNLKDDSSGQWGVVDSNFAKKDSFGRIEDVATHLAGKSFTRELTATDRRLIEPFDQTSGWGQQFNTNGATASLSQVTGTTGNGMKADYTFGSSSSAVILTKDIALSGQPTAIGVDVKGDGNGNPAILRVRFTDAKGETFQGLLGNATGDWRYLQFDFSQTGAMTSWNGDGKIDFPIHFNSLVVDRDGGSASGAVSFDSLVAVYGPADYKAYQFGDTVAAWKGSGSGTTTIDGQTKTLSEQPIYYTDASTAPSPTTSADAYHAAWVSQSGYPTLSAGQSAKLTVTLKNTGSTTWQQDTVKLGTDRAQDRVPVFTRDDLVDHNPSGWLSANRVKMQEASVAPGQTGTFTFYYTVPNNLAAGTYREYFRPVAEGITWMEDMGIYWDMTVQ